MAYDEVHVPSSKSCSLFAACLIGALLLLSYPYLGIFGRSWFMIPGQRNRCVFLSIDKLLHCTYFAEVCFARNMGNRQVGLWGTAPKSPQESPCGDMGNWRITMFFIGKSSMKGPCSMANCYTMAMFCQTEYCAEFV